MTFKEAYKLPLVASNGTVWTNDDNMAFMFANRILEEEIHTVSETEQRNIIHAINGFESEPATYDLEYDATRAVLTLDGKSFIILRGWGHLTGSGGLNLPEDTATRIQDEFAEYIIKQLS